MYTVLKYYGGIILSGMLLACARETVVPVKADFSVTVLNDDYSVPVKVSIKNHTQGADTYQWTFDGAIPANAAEKNPPPLVYNNPGSYKITLNASNKDSAKDTKTFVIQTDHHLKTNFSWNINGSNIAPATLQMIYNFPGVTEYRWEFQDGIPATSNEPAPKVVFTKGGKHVIKLTITNGRETYSEEQSVTIRPPLSVDFDWSVAFIDQDYQAPVRLRLNNRSVSAVSYEWTVAGAAPSVSAEENPEINLTLPGTYTLILKAANDKETKTTRKQLSIFPDNNLLSFKNIKLGINTAQSAIGCFFSSQLGKVIPKDDVNADNGAQIDFAYFGLDDAFSHNEILSPDEVQNTVFLAIPKAMHTKVINSQELVTTQLTTAQFDALSQGAGLSSVVVDASEKGKKPFNNRMAPRVVLLQTTDGRKGALKITSFTSSGKNSYILTDIKIQKKPE